MSRSNKEVLSSAVMMQRVAALARLLASDEDLPEDIIIKRDTAEALIAAFQRYLRLQGYIGTLARDFENNPNTKGFSMVLDQLLKDDLAVLTKDLIGDAVMEAPDPEEANFNRFGLLDLED